MDKKDLKKEVILLCIVLALVIIVAVFVNIFLNNKEQTNTELNTNAVTDLNGNEIKVNDGNTWVHICPKNADVEITGNEDQEEVNSASNTSNNL